MEERLDGEPSRPVEPTAFEAAVRAHLRPIEGRPDYHAALQSHLDTTRFDVLMREVSAYRPVAGARVLSSGCGSAADLHAALRAGARAVSGIEVSEALVAMANQRLADSFGDAPADVRVYDGVRLPYADAAFDIVLSIHVIEHAGQPERYLTELLRVASPGGCVLIDLPNRYYAFEQHSWVPLLHYLPACPHDALIRALTRSWLRRLTSDDWRYRLSASAGLDLVSPDRLVNIAQNIASRWPTAIADAYFHSYGDHRVRYTGNRATHLLGAARRCTTFRLVLRRHSGFDGMGAAL